ncbi:MAG: hypothetical protein KGJ23_08635 [Euryarchaeota archaeon]|nr:hypothetical protein [Euryarchaeota archaeon]MDE1836669.1 hypothetical protein [Euryarchaeota archaeon]MDE1880302.1 hypothetical protein [Euryarchaeota archaeon]MDE2044639.1 hypothetical protein [Thermoplasmata archaeon]
MLEPEPRPTTILQRAAEKAWLEVIRATDQFLDRNGAGTPEPRLGNPQRRESLRRLGHGDIADEFTILESRLFSECFLYGECDNLDHTLDRAEKYVADLKATRPASSSG